MNDPHEVSIIEATRFPLDLSSDLLNGSLSATTHQHIDFKMQPQCHSNWCWAAVASSVSVHNNNNSTFTQCAIANLELRRHDCCEFLCGIDNLDFNIPHTLGAPLNRVGCLDRLTRNHQATRIEVQQEINAGRPVCVRTLWSGGGAHFLAIVGYLPESDSLVLRDPWFGSIPEITYDRFCAKYQDLGGVWKDTYYTKAPD